MEKSHSQPTAQMKEILDVFASFKTPPLENLTPENARNLPTFSDAVTGVIGNHFLKRAMPFPEPVESIQHVLVQGAESELLARVYHPKGVEGSALPILLYFHGGGWVIANLDTYDGSCRALANESGYIVVSVAYRQSPEYPFPAAKDDAIAAYRWLLENGSRIGGDTKRIAIAGESAGGNLAAVVCLNAKAEGLPMPIHQLLVYPVTDLTFQGRSHAVHANEKPLNEPMMYWFKRHYLRGKAESMDPNVSPYFARDHKGMPTTTIVVAELDPLCSDGEMYATKLRTAGVDVELRKFEGVTHEFFGAKAVLEEAREAITFACEELKMALESRPHHRSAREIEIEKNMKMF